MSTRTALRLTVMRILILSIFLCCLLAGAFWYFITAPQVRVPYMQPYQLPEENLAIEADIEIALKYPLFWSSRLPVAEPEEAEEEPVVIEAGSIEGMRLLGIIVRDSVRTALLGIDKKIQIVVKNDEVNGWVVEQVLANKVVLMANGQIAELSIVRERPDSIRLEPVAQ